MSSQSNNAVLGFLIAKAHARAGKFDGVPFPLCEESVAIFDELDSLDADEFAEVYKVYLIGSGMQPDIRQAHQSALAAKFVPLEVMANDPNLHVVLSRGVERWQLHARQS